MIRQTDIPRVNPGDPISASLLNQLVNGANTGRSVQGDEGIEATSVGGMMSFADKRPPAIYRDVLVYVNPGFVSVKNSENVEILSAGIYEGRMFLQPSISIHVTTGGTTESPTPSPNAQTCWVVNAGEFNHNTRQIRRPIIALGQIRGELQGLPLVIINASRDNGMFPVIVVENGDDGTNPLYDLYETTDTAHARRLALQKAPKCSRARWQSAIPVTAAVADSVASAYLDAAGVVQLFDCAETIETCE